MAQGQTDSSETTKQKIIECLKLKSEMDKTFIPKFLMTQGRKGLTTYKNSLSPTLFEEMSKGRSDLFQILSAHFEKKLLEIDQAFVEEQQNFSSELYQRILNNLAEGDWKIPPTISLLWLVIRFLFPSSNESNGKFEEHKKKLICEGFDGVPKDIAENNRDVISRALKAYYDVELSGYPNLNDQLPIKHLVQHGWWIGIHHDEFRSKCDEETFEKLKIKYSEFQREHRQIEKPVKKENEEEKKLIEQYHRTGKKFDVEQWKKFEEFVEFRPENNLNSQIEALLQHFVYFLKYQENLRYFRSLIQNHRQISFRMLIDFLLFRCDSNLHRSILSLIIESNPVPFVQPVERIHWEIFDFVDRSSSVLVLSFSFTCSKEKSALVNRLFNTSFEEPKESCYFQQTIDVQTADLSLTKRKIVIADCHGEMTERLLTMVSPYFDVFLVYLDAKERETRQDFLRKISKPLVFLNEQSTKDDLLRQCPPKASDFVKRSNDNWHLKIESIRTENLSIQKTIENEYLQWIQSASQFEIDLKDEHQRSFLFRTCLPLENISISIVTILGRTQRDQMNFFNLLFGTSFNFTGRTDRLIGILKEIHWHHILFLIPPESSDKENILFSLCLSHLIIVYSDDELKMPTDLLRHLDVPRIQRQRNLHVMPSSLPIDSSLQLSQDGQINAEYLRKKSTLRRKLLEISSEKIANILKWILMAIDVQHCLTISFNHFLWIDENEKKRYKTFEEIFYRQVKDLTIEQLVNKENEIKQILFRISSEKFFDDQIENFFDEVQRQQRKQSGDKNRLTECFQYSSPTKSIDQCLIEFERNFRDEYSEEKTWRNSLKFVSTFYQLFQRDFFFDEKTFQTNNDAEWTKRLIQRAYSNSFVVNRHDESINHETFSIEFFEKFQHLNRLALIDRFLFVYTKEHFSSTEFQTELWNRFVPSFTDWSNNIANLRLSSDEQFQSDIRKSIEQQRPMILPNFQLNEGQLYLPLSRILGDVIEKINGIIKNSSNQQFSFDFFQNVTNFIKKRIDEIDDELKIFSLKLSRSFRMILHEVVVFHLSKSYFNQTSKHFNELLSKITEARSSVTSDSNSSTMKPIVDEVGEKTLRRWIRSLAEECDQKQNSMIESYFQHRTDFNRQFFQNEFERKLLVEKQVNLFVEYLQNPIDTIKKTYATIPPSEQKLIDKHIEEHQYKYRTMIVELFRYLKDLITLFEPYTQPKENLHRLFKMATNDFSMLTSTFNEKQRALDILFNDCLTQTQVSTSVIVNPTITFSLDVDFHQKLQNLIRARQIDRILIEIIKNDAEKRFIEVLPNVEKMLVDHFRPKSVENEIVKCYKTLVDRSIGCEELCPFCRRLCDVDHQSNPNSQHACINGHQLRIYAGSFIEMTGEPSLFTCNDLIDFHRLNKDQDDARWNEWKFINSHWNFDFSINSNEHKEKQKQIWNIVGPTILQKYSTMNFVSNNQSLIKIQRSFHFFMIFDFSTTPSNELWSKKVNNFQKLIDQRAIGLRDSFTGIFYKKPTKPTEQFRIQFSPLPDCRKLRIIRDQPFQSIGSSMDQPATTAPSIFDKIPILLFDESDQNFISTKINDLIKEIFDAVRTTLYLNQQFENIRNIIVLDIEKNIVFLENFYEKFFK